jgi:hypothetical protein
MSGINGLGAAIVIVDDFGDLDVSLVADSA